MISFVTGVPGSGKTYYAVNEIHKYLIKPKYTSLQKLLLKFGLISFDYGKYDNVLTNINEFRFDKMQSNSQELFFKFVDGDIEDKDYLYDKLLVLHDLYLTGANDKDLILKSKDLGLYKALIVIDEAHNYLDKEDKVLIWWLTYHRHLYQELIFITQNLSLVNSKYKKLCEVFIRAHSSSLKLNKSVFPYSIFMDSLMSQKSKTGIKKIKFNQDVFKLYHSGDSTKSDNIILKYLIYALIFIIILFIGGYLFFSSKVPVPVEKSKMSLDTDIKYTIQKSKQKEDFDISKYSYIKITCLGSSCNYNDMIIPETVIRYVIKNTQSKILESKSNIKLNTKDLHCFINESFKNQFNRSQNENNLPNTIDFFNRQ